MSNDKKLVRKKEGRMLAGVAAGLAEYTGLDVTLLRVLFVVFAIFGGAGLVIYIVMWILVPEEGSDRAVANDIIDSVGKKDSPEAPAEEAEE